MGLGEGSQTWAKLETLWQSLELDFLVGLNLTQSTHLFLCEYRGYHTQ